MKHRKCKECYRAVNTANERIDAPRQYCFECLTYVQHSLDRRHYNGINETSLYEDIEWELKMQDKHKEEKLPYILIID